MNIRSAGPGDADAIAQIYNYYIRESWATFEVDELDTGDALDRLESVAARGLPWLVGESDGELIGYAYATVWNVRDAYRHSVETTIYLEPGVVRRGHGRRLYNALIDAVREREAHVVIGVISLPNSASVALHETLGFRKAGHLAEVGHKFNRWIDVGYWQLTL